MPITIFDGIVIGVILFSAVLAMVRGFSREILSIVSWGGSAVAAYYLYSLLVPYALHYTADTRIATIASAAVIFLIALIIISFITIRIADFIIDSRIGALDRTLGFLFGAARGLLLMVVVVAFWNWLVAPPAAPGMGQQRQVEAFPQFAGRKAQIRASGKHPGDASRRDHQQDRTEPAATAIAAAGWWR